jgi:hypothetical protein
MYMRGIVTNEIADYINNVVNGTIDTDPIEFIRSVDERAFHTLSSISAILSKRAAADMQLTLSSSVVDISEVTAAKLHSAATREINMALAYGWILEHLSRIAIDLKRTPNLSLYMSAAIDAEGDLKELKKKISTKQTKIAESKEVVAFNDFMKTLDTSL